MEVKKVKLSESENVFNIYQTCINLHQKLGFNQWDQTYPNVETIRKDIQEGWLFGLYLDNKSLVAVISITKDEPLEYHLLNWSDATSHYFIVHRLCVSESFLRKGYAKVLMAFAEDSAINKGLTSIRLDTFSLNKGALDFYKGINYKVVGKVCFPKKKDADYTCFEKLL